MHGDNLGEKDGPKLPELPGLDDKPKDIQSNSLTSKPGSKSTVPGINPKPSKETPEDPFDALVKRFEALKRK